MLWIFLFALMGLGFQFWQVQQNARETALKRIRQHCQQEGLQLLDDTLVSGGIGLTKTTSGWRVRRCYRFEFSSTGDQRYSGQLEMVGRAVRALELAPHR